MRKVALSMLVLFVCWQAGANAAVGGAGAPSAQDPQDSVTTSPRPAGTPTFARVEGRLTQPGGDARTGNVLLIVSVYATENDATPLWVEQQTVTLDSAGRYAVLVGGTLPDGIPKDVFLAGSARWIGLAVSGEPEQPRIQLVAVPYALKAVEADTLAGKSATDFVLSENLGERIKTAMAAQTGVSASGSNGTGSGAGTSGNGAGTNAVAVNALVKYTTAGGAEDSSLLFESGGVLTVNGQGNHSFAGANNADQSLAISTNHTGNAARAILNLTAGTVANYLIGYGSGNVGGLSGVGGELAFYTQGLGGLSLAAISGTGAIRLYTGGTTERMRLSPTGLLTVTGLGSHGFFGSANSDQTLGISNSSTGAAARSVLNVTAGSVANYLIGYGSGNAGGLSGLGGEFAFYTQGAGGLSLAATGATGDVRFYSGGTNERARIDALGNMGLGVAAPAYKLDVLHGGATGIRSRSSASFSVVDIDANSGDAALRFYKAGVGQWNIRNRPADDYLEIFELGGGGSRMVIQDATGNVGIGETTAPAYKLDVLHGGATGERIRSSASFSVLDIDAFSGDAALRFINNGVNQWNVRNRPSDNYLEIFELGGGGSRMVIQDATGNVGIGETTAPAHKLDVLDAGAAPAERLRSSASWTGLDIDAFNGDAALRFAKNGVQEWLIRNDPATNNLQFWDQAAGERMRIDKGTGKVWVAGAFTATGIKAFSIDHPLDPEHKILMHAAAESNEVINFYSGNVTTDANGKATVQLPDYFEAINLDPRYQLTVIGTFAQAIVESEVQNNQFRIATDKPNVKVSWEVKGVRNDTYMRAHPFQAETDKAEGQKGTYLGPAVYNTPQGSAPAVSGAPSSSVDDVRPAATSRPQGNAAADAAVLSSVSDLKLPVAMIKATPLNLGPSSIDEFMIRR